jgi:outer membrane protein assembly factor BamB
MRQVGRRRRRALVPIVAALLLGACSADWSTWGFGVDRQGYNAAESTISTGNVGQLHQRWSVDLGAYINAAAVVATGVNVGGVAKDLVYVGTEHGILFALTTDGKIVWYRSLGSHQMNCPDTPDMIYGVSASVVYDRAGNRIFAAGGDGHVYALDPATGNILNGWPVAISSDPGHETVYSAPTLFGGRLYVELAGRCDQTPYHGRILAIDTSTRATNQFYVTGSATGPNGGGIWGWGGVSIDPANGDVYAATGNALIRPENAFYAEHVIRLSSTLQVKAAHSPGVAIVDDDFGSTPVLFQKNGCPPQLVVEQKNGSLYLYDRDAIAAGYRQRVLLNQELIGVPGYSPATSMVYVVNPVTSADGTYKAGLLAFRLDAGCNLQLAWQAPAPVGVGSTPTIANGIVYYSSGSPGIVHALDASTGQPLWASGAELAGPVLAAPVVVNGILFDGSYDNHLHAWGT